VLVGERPTQHDEAGVDETIHEGRVRRPVRLLLEWPRWVPPGARSNLHDEERRHAPDP
jgi:hypothetical protein